MPKFRGSVHLVAKYARWRDERQEYLDEFGAHLPLYASPYEETTGRERVDLLKTMHDTPRLLVLGEPGMGKTVALERMVWEVAGAGEPVVPIFVPLIYYRGNLLEWVRTGLQEGGGLHFPDLRAVEAFLRATRCWFLFDGLNEVPGDHRDQAVSEIASVLRAYPRHSAVVTSRSQDELWRRLREKDVPEAVVIHEISQAQVEEYLAACLGRPGRALYERLDERLRGLVRNPLRLWMLKETAAQGGVPLPTNRGELFASFVKTQFERDRAKVGTSIPAAVKRAGLARLAFAMQVERQLSCSVRQAVEVMDEAVCTQGYGGQAVVDEAKVNGLLVGEEQVRFPHQSLQEYFVALTLREMVDEEAKLPGWRQAWRRLRSQHLALRARDDWWAEPFVQLAGLTGRPSWLAREVARENPWLAYWCMVEGRAVDKKTRQEVETRSVTALTSTRVGERRRAVQALAQLENPRTIPHLVTALGDEDGEVVRMARRALAGMGEAAVKPLQEVLRQDDLLLRLRAGGVLLTLGVEEGVKEVLVEALGLVYIPPGPFTMGSDDSDAFGDEKPVHQVHLDGYWIGRYPVTNAQYARFVEAGGYEERKWWSEEGWSWRQGTYDSKAPGYLKGWLAERPAEKRDRPFWWDDRDWANPLCPVVGVSWFEAVAYCRWLSAESGLQVRLPTEAEWEKAARGTDGRKYPWGNNWDPERCNTSERGPGHTTPVGQYSSPSDSPYGVADMAGNVWEWTSSLYKKYPYRADGGREGPEAEGARVLRDGSWSSLERYARCASRIVYGPVSFLSSVGFRVLSLALPSESP